MEGSYEVVLGDAVVGKVQLRQEGLYYRVSCVCDIPQGRILRLYAEGEGCRENLGIPVPEGENYILRKRIPAKRLRMKTVRFVLAPGMVSGQGTFVPILPEEPFLYIERLKDAFLESERGRVGIRVEKHPEALL